MGDSQTGGDGSVQWSVDGTSVADTGPKAPRNQHTNPGKGPHHQDGVDDDGAIGDFFTVSIRVPQGVAVDEYLRQFVWQVDGRRIWFNLPIEEDPLHQPDQVRVSWGDSVHHKGIGGKKKVGTS